MKPIQSTMLLCALAGMVPLYSDPITIHYRGTFDDTPPVYVALVQVKGKEPYPSMKVKGLEKNDYAALYKINHWGKVVAQRPSLVTSDRKVDTYIIAANSENALRKFFGMGSLDQMGEGLVVKEKIGQVGNKDLYLFYNREIQTLRKPASLELYTSLQKFNNKDNKDKRSSLVATHKEAEWKLEKGEALPTAKRNELPPHLYVENVRSADKPAWSRYVSIIKLVNKYLDNEVTRKRLYHGDGDRFDPQLVAKYIQSKAPDLKVTVTSDGTLRFDPVPDLPVPIHVTGKLNKKMKEYVDFLS